MLDGVKDKSAELQHVANALAWIQAHRKMPDGTPLSARAVCKEAGLDPSHADRIKHGRQASIKVSTVVALAQRWNVRVEWMLSGKGPREPYDPNEVQARADAIESADPELRSVLRYHGNRDRWSNAARAAAMSVRDGLQRTQQQWEDVLNGFEKALSDS